MDASIQELEMDRAEMSATIKEHERKINMMSRTIGKITVTHMANNDRVLIYPPCWS